MHRRTGIIGLAFGLMVPDTPYLLINPSLRSDNSFISATIPIVLAAFCGAAHRSTIDIAWDLAKDCRNPRHSRPWVCGNSLQSAACDQSNDGGEGKRTQQCGAGAVTQRAGREFQRLLAPSNHLIVATLPQRPEQDRRPHLQTRP
jgi:hypothetical protein